jgi:hypothetical protein
VTKMLDLARPSGPSGGRSPLVVARLGTDVPGSAGFGREMRDATSDAALNRTDAHPVEMNVVEFLEARRYRERVDEEVGKGSDRAARWWSRRLVQLYEEAGLVRLDK